MNERKTPTDPDRGDSGSLVPLAVAAIIIVGGLAFLFLYDARANRFTNAPNSPFETIALTVEAPVVRDAGISPDGKSVVFAAGDEMDLDIHVRSIDVELPVVLASSSALERNPAWSPDGREIVFTRDHGGSTELVTTSFRGGAERTVVQIDGEVRDLDWSGGSIYYSARSRSDQPWSIESIRIDDRTTRDVTSPTPGRGDHSLAVSPEGDRIAFAREVSDGADDLFVRDLTTGEERRLTTDGLPVFGIDWAGD
ncbi:MAG: hypothetical protein R3338_15870, partial [Thermoanaerobaculia bacterium]|nr:hypothetical protein [Thermoanaerobaculia bacterium]